MKIYTFDIEDFSVREIFCTAYNVRGLAALNFFGTYHILAIPGEKHG